MNNINTFPSIESSPGKFYVRGDGEIVTRTPEELERIYTSTFGKGPDTTPEEFKKYSGYEDITKKKWDNKTDI